MQPYGTGKRCRWLATLGGLLVLATLAGSQAFAKGPPPDPDFSIESLGAYFVATGAIEETFFRDRVFEWTDETDPEVVWIQWRFHYGDEESNYFDTVLPKYPKNGTRYPIEFTAAPGGFVSGGVLLEGTWAVGIATGNTHDGWEWVYDWWLGRRVKWPVKEASWDPLEGYLLP
jgi:hypothetical protein